MGGTRNRTLAWYFIPSPVSVYGHYHDNIKQMRTKEIIRNRYLCFDARVNNPVITRGGYMCSPMLILKLIIKGQVRAFISGAGHSMP